MKKYGYMDKDGYLKVAYANEETRPFRNLKGEKKERTISIEESIELLEAKGYKLVEEIDEAKVLCPEEEYYLQIPIPYDKGDSIGYRYVKRFDFHKVKLKIEDIKDELSKSDIKITRLYEASLIDPNTNNKEAKALLTKRQAMREEVGKLQDLMNIEREKQAKELGISADFKRGKCYNSINTKKLK